MTGRRGGFTLVELLMVALLSSLVVAAAYSVLITSQRTYTVERVKIRSTQVLRAGMDVLMAELREISPEEGDIVAMDEDSVTVRVARNFGIVCSVNSHKPPYNAAVLKIGNGFAGADSVFLFADNDSELRTDDEWVPAVIDGFSQGASCGPRVAETLRLNTPLGYANDSISVGAAVRGFKTYTYRTARMYYGDVYLVRSAPGGPYEAMVGPLADEDGLVFRYLDDEGNVTSDRDDVRRIEVTMRTDSDARNAAGNLMSDSMTATVYTRN